MNELLCGMAWQAMLTALFLRMGYKIDMSHQLITGALLAIAALAFGRSHS